jgi:hypothetical protein
LKYVYEWLPIGKILKVIDPKATTKCPLCGISIESPLHLCCCQEKERQAITMSCIKAISEINDKWKVNSLIGQEINNSLHNWTSYPTNNPKFDRIQDIRIRTILESQSKIVWGNFLNSFISKQFQNCINTQCDKELNQFEEICWTCEIVQCIWDHEELHWKRRNGDKHGHNAVGT